MGVCVDIGLDNQPGLLPQDSAMMITVARLSTHRVPASSHFTVRKRHSYYFTDEKTEILRTVKQPPKLMPSGNSQAGTEPICLSAELHSHLRSSWLLAVWGFLVLKGLGC